MARSSSCLCLVVSILCFGASRSRAQRLREHVVQWPGLETSDLPIDPSGKSGPKRTAGYFDLKHTAAAEMFYFFFESRGNPSTDPVVLWMTGGPGCSSELAVFYENGPFHINKNLTLSDNKYGWDVNHNMIYVDQPIGTGFSYTTDTSDAVYDEHGVAHDMLDFLVEFLEAHPELADNDFYVTGESYAGHYVPAVSHRLWQYNKGIQDESERVNLKGFAIGNGLTDPAIQYAAYGDYALQNKLIDDIVYQRMKAAMPACKTLIEVCNAHGWAFECKGALMYCNSSIFGQVLMAAGGVNVYDIRKKCIGPLCYDFGLLDKYLAQDSVKKALGVGSRKFVECDSTVHMHMLGDWMKNFDQIIPEMLADGIRVMVYAGDKDLICNYVGNRAWVDALKWKQADTWNQTKDFEWHNDGAAAGLVKSVGPLTFVQVYDAGHMVPMDQPSNALDMLLRFTSDNGFADALPTTLKAATIATADSLLKTMPSQ